MLSPAIHKIECPQGVTFSKIYTVTIDGSPLNLTGYTARMQVRPDAASGKVYLNLTTENGGITLGGAAGTVTLNASAAVTSAIVSGVHKYDLELVSGGGVVTRYLMGDFEVSAGVTR